MTKKRTSLDENALIRHTKRGLIVSFLTNLQLKHINTD